jgi:ABC-type antimicrobial peptide transport system permease subunit
VAVAQLAAAWLTSLREQRRDIAVLRAMGASTAQLVGRSAVGAALIGAVATLLGLPIGVWALHRLGDQLAHKRGLGPGVIQTPALASLLLAATTLTAAASVLASAVTYAVVRHNTASELRD